MLNKTYLWLDWFSMPQPGAAKVEDIGEMKLNALRAEGSKAIRSIPAYVERSDFILILVPECHHSDRKVPTCFRTWRRRGWCLLEFYAAAMARDSSNPPLLVSSEKGTPVWLSPMEVMSLSVGGAEFTCCQRNHVITTETQKVMNGGDDVKKIPCDKPIAAGILEQLIDAKISHLFNSNQDMVMARFYRCFKHWWMRGLSIRAHEENKQCTSLSKFKKRIRWSHEENQWFDDDGVGLLMYAVISNETVVVGELLKNLEQNFKGEDYTRRLESRVRNEGYATLGIPGGVKTFPAAMMLASPDIISLLLQYVDVMEFEREVREYHVAHSFINSFLSVTR